jgi:UDP-N-acetylglucosamine--N-acetylmuramyl-(pentapeptide) pyrophosphoryl-undecaprenol N-acetylglucosamine transferase
MTAPNRPIVLAAGGTGGHVFPAQSLAGALADRGIRIALITDRRANALDGALATADTYRIRAGGLSGRGAMQRLVALAELGIGFLQARRILKSIDPMAIVGFGSYASAPTMAAAVTLGCRTVIHEQNAILGRANRLFASRVTNIATAFRSVANLRDEDRPKTVWTGNPVRSEIIGIAGQPYPAIEDDGPINLLVFGGSLGATVFSKVVPEALTSLSDTIQKRLRLTQQCRAEDLDAVRKIYDDAGLQAELAPFFSDMPNKLAAAHLVICRAGASTIAELAAAGRPAILVPYPHATDDHQTKNAECLCDAGGGWMIQQEAFTAESLAARLTTLLSNTKSLRTTALCAGQIGMRNATDNLTDLVLSAAGYSDNGDTVTGMHSREAAE